MSSKIFLLFLFLCVVVSTTGSSDEDGLKEVSTKKEIRFTPSFLPFLGASGDWLFSLFGGGAVPGWFSMTYFILGLCHIIIWPLSCICFCTCARFCGKKDEDAPENEAVYLCVCCLVWTGCCVCILCVLGPFLFEFWPIVDAVLLFMYISLCCCALVCALLNANLDSWDASFRDIYRPYKLGDGNRRRRRRSSNSSINNSSVDTSVVPMETFSTSSGSNYAASSSPRIGSSSYSSGGSSLPATSGTSSYAVSRSSGSGSYAATSTDSTNQKTQLQIATAAMLVFVQISHIEGKDRCSIGTFGTYYSMRLYYETLISTIQSVLIDIIRRGTSGTTRLYESMIDYGGYLTQNKRLNTPLIMIVVTDGDDTTRMNQTECAYALKEKFTSQPGLNMCFLLGVGNSVNHSSLESMMDTAGGIYIKVEDFGKLAVVFQFISAKLCEIIRVGVVGVETQDFALTGVSVSKENHVVRGPMDYGILLDISGSMNSKVRF